MKAKIMIPNNIVLSPEVYRAIKFGSKEWASSCFHAMDYIRYAYQWESTIELPTLEAPMTEEIFNKAQYDFLEDCFEHTAMSEDWQGKRPICVGDILVIKGGGTWFCAPTSWEKI
jgi:hypothetical protein